MSKSARVQLRELGITIPETTKEAEAQELLDQLQTATSEPGPDEFDLGGASPRG